MRFSIVAAVAAFSSTALAQGLLDQIPKCAQTCFGSNLGTCSIADIACICSSKALDAVTCCVFATCSQAEIASTTQFAVQLCKLQSINVNTQPVCPSGSATASAAMSGSMMTSAASSMGSMMTGTASMMSSGSGALSSAASAASSRAASAASAATATGAAPMQTAGAGLGFGVAVAGLLAAL